MPNNDVELPSPESIRSRISTNLQQHGASLMRRCSTALQGTLSPSVTVAVPSETPTEAVQYVIGQLVARGYHVRHWLGDQREPDNSLIISINP